MKIGINSLSQSAEGGRVYLKNLLSKLDELDSANQYLVFAPQDNKIQVNFSENFKIIQLEVKSGDILKRFFYEQIVLPVLIRKYNVDIFFSPADTAPIFSLVPVVLAIQNPNPYHILSKWNFTNKIKFLILRTLSWISIKKAKQVIFVSDYSRKKVLSKLPWIKKEKLSTVYHGMDAGEFLVSSSISSKTKELIDKNSPFLLTISSIAPHKNMEILIEAFNKLPQKLQEKYSLLIVGGLGEKDYLQKLKSQVDKLSLKKEIIFTGRIPYKEVSELYKEASLYLLPSQLETFGLTLVEAMASETPVIAANAASLPEVCKDAALYFPPDSSQKAAQKIEKVLTDPGMRKSMIKKGKRRAQDFSWNKTAKQTLNLLKKASN